MDSYTEPQPDPNVLLQVSSRELHNNLASTKKYGGIKEARDEDDNIIISNSTLSSLFTPQLRKMLSRYKVICGYKCSISEKSMHSSLLS